MSDQENPLSAALRLVFGPLVKQTKRWPAPLAYGFAAIVAVLLIVLGRATLPPNQAWLTTVIVLAPLAAFVFSDWSARRQARALTITGNVLREDGLPVKGAVVFVDGVDRKKETDETGWFQIAVDARPSWTVRTQFGGRAAHRTIIADEAVHPVVLTLPAGAVTASGSAAEKAPAAETESLLRLVPREGSEGAPFESRQRLTTIGRSPKSSLCIGDSTVSWEHAQIVLMSDGYHYRHIGSNPTVLSRRGEEWAIRPGVRDDMILRNGDRLTIGNAAYVVELNLAAADAGTGYITTEREAGDTP